MMLYSFLKRGMIILSLGFLTSFIPDGNSRAWGYSVCGMKGEIASFKTRSYLITICPGEASLHLILMYHDGTGYKRIPVEESGDKFRGSDGKNNFIIDRRQLVIGTDGEVPIRESVIEFK